MSNGAGKFIPFSQIYQVELQRSLKKSERSHERYRGKTQRLPRFLREYRGDVPGCAGGVGAYVKGKGSPYSITERRVPQL